MLEFLHLVSEHDTASQGYIYMSREGKVCPWELVEASIRATQPYDVFFLRSMLAVPYFEKVRARANHLG